MQDQSGSYLGSEPRFTTSATSCAACGYENCRCCRSCGRYVCQCEELEEQAEAQRIEALMNR